MRTESHESGGPAHTPPPPPPDSALGRGKQLKPYYVDHKNKEKRNHFIEDLTLTSAPCLNIQISSPSLYITSLIIDAATELIDSSIQLIIRASIDSGKVTWKLWTQVMTSEADKGCY